MPADSTTVPPAHAAAAGRHPLRILIVNQTATAALSHAQVAHATVSLRTQAVEFARSWRLVAPQVDVAPASVAQAHVDAGTVDLVLALLDDADQAGALGYHSEDSHGVFYARVFVATCQANHVSWTSCASHEICEALADLAVDRWASDPHGRLWAVEVCDPVESDVYTDSRGVELSDYVLPSWFDDAGHAPFDRLGKVTAPFTMSHGGYAVVMTGGRPSQIFGDVEGWRQETKTTELSRTARRLTTPVWPATS